jgi:hypothetical protein
MLVGALFCSGLILAQTPVQDIDQNLHPNLAAAQSHVVQADTYIVIARKDNTYDMKGHAEKARQYLAQANQELKLAAEAANAANARQKR